MAAMRLNEAELAGWEAWEGVDGHLHARRPRTSPPLGVRAGGIAELEALIARAEAELAEGVFWERVFAARQLEQDECDLRTWQQERRDRLRPVL